MGSLNRVDLIGRLGKDVELRYTQGGTAVANFSLATDERVKVNDKWESKPEWHSIVMFGKLAENAETYLKKGSSVYLSGRIQTRKWQDKEGRDRYTTEIVAFTMQFLGGKNDSGGSRRDNGDPGYESGGPSNPPDSGFDPNDDVPF